MDGVTDHACRHIQKKYGSPAVVYTEFVAVERLRVGDWSLLKDFRYDESQRPVVAQVYGHTPALFEQMAILLCELGFDGIDLNMGCPATKIVHRGSGAGLIRTPLLAQELVRATRRGVEAWQNGANVQEIPELAPHLVEQVVGWRAQLPPAFQRRRPVPVSVKTRIGYAVPQVREWIPWLLECEPSALALHGRTLQQRYSGSADWEQFGLAAELARGSDTLLLGNGDVGSYSAAVQCSAAYGLDGVLIGRGSNGNPFVFSLEQPQDRYRLLRVALEHAQLHEAISDRRPGRFLAMRKHLGWYARWIPAASALRRALVGSTTAAEVAALLDAYFLQRRTWEPGMDSGRSDGGKTVIDWM